MANADWNADGRSDILWRNRVTGNNGVWILSDDLQSATPLTIERQVNTNWYIGGVGDFDSDGEQDDIVWRNPDTGENGIWIMDGPVRTDIITIDSDNNPAWEIQAAGDFDRDGDDDLFWRNTENGNNGIWFMEDDRVVGKVNVRSEPNTNWQVYGAEDFDGDDRDDLLWRDEKVTGNNGVWLMRNNEIKSTEVIRSEGNLDWYIGGAGDFQGDGGVDILWRDRQTGANGLWIMDGLNVVTTSSAIPAENNTDWLMAVR